MLISATVTPGVNDIGGPDNSGSDIDEQDSLDSDIDEPGIIELDIGEFRSTFSSHQPVFVNRISVPAMALSLPPAPATTPACSPTPVPEPELMSAPTVLKTHGWHPLIISSRENVGFPDYAYHPLFVRPGASRTCLEKKKDLTLCQVFQVLTSVLRRLQVMPPVVYTSL